MGIPLVTLKPSSGWSRWSEVEDVFNRGWYTHTYAMGKWTRKFERKFARQRGFLHCCVYSGGTPALLRTLMKISGLRIERSLGEAVMFTNAPIAGHWAVLTDSRWAWMRLKQLGAQGYSAIRDKGADKDDMDLVGFNFRVGEVCAAVLYHLLVTDTLAFEAPTTADS